MNKKIVAITLLVLMFFAAVLAPIALVVGQSSLGIEILQVSPANNISYSGQSTYNGTVGEVFNLEGTIDVSNGSYKIILGTNVVFSGTAQGYYVDANFSVPQTQAGSYPLTLEDVTANLNSTANTPESFKVLIGYNIAPIPLRIQEGNSVLLNVNVTAGAPNTAYVANVTVELPSPLKTNYTEILPLGTSSQEGTAKAQITFPGSGFQPSGDTTNYAGSYNVYFNESAGLATNKFNVDMLNSTTYHRGQTVAVYAIDYQPNQPGTLSITNVASGTSLYSESLTASPDGNISATWQVPPSAAIGNYNVTITPVGTQKAVLDSEVFSVPGYSIQVKTVNLANAPVSDILVQALDKSSNLIYNSTSNAFGVADINLESGPQVLTAFSNGVNVGEMSITVTGNSTFTLQCQLTDLVIKVQNENGVPMPLVNLVITYTYQPTNESAQIGNSSLQTGTSGTCVLNSTFTGINYTIQASLYNQVFNSGNDTINNLPAQAVSEVFIICPNEALTLNVVGYNKAAVSGANIELIELTNGLFYTATTNSSGSATSQVTFGEYKLQIYDDSILINQTTVDAFSASQQQIICDLYGIQVSVSVVDFFGTPIANANVTLNGPGTERFSGMTQSDGTTTFNNVVGGEMQIVAFAQGAQSSYQAVTLKVDKPTSVQIQIDKYFLLGSLLVPVSLLITIIIILVAIVLLLTVEIYRRKKVKSFSKS